MAGMNFLKGIKPDDVMWAAADGAAALVGAGIAHKIVLNQILSKSVKEKIVANGQAQLPIFTGFTSADVAEYENKWRMAYIAVLGAGILLSNHFLKKPAQKYAAWGALAFVAMGIANSFTKGKSLAKYFPEMQPGTALAAAPGGSTTIPTSATTVMNGDEETVRIPADRFMSYLQSMAPGYESQTVHGEIEEILDGDTIEDLLNGDDDDLNGGLDGDDDDF